MPKEKLVLETNYYHPGYIPEQKGDAPVIMKDLVDPPVKIKEEDQGEDQRKQDKEEGRKEDSGRLGRKQMKKMIIQTILILVLFTKRRSETTLTKTL